MRWSSGWLLPVLATVGFATAMADESNHRTINAVPGYPSVAFPMQPSVWDPVPLTTVPDEDDADYIDHLGKAAEHLRAAGLHSLANHIRGLPYAANATTPSKNMRSTDVPAQVQINVKLIEVDREKALRFGIHPEAIQVFSGKPQLKGAVEDFLNNGLACVLADPTLVTVIGRPAQLRSGGKVLRWEIGPNGKPVQRPEYCGTSVNVIPRLGEKRDLRLELRVEHSEVDATKTELVAGKESPVIRKRVVDTVLEMKFGETLALSGPPRLVNNEATGPTSKVMVMLVKAEAIKSVTAVQPSDGLRRR